MKEKIKEYNMLRELKVHDLGLCGRHGIASKDERGDETNDKKIQKIFWEGKF